MKKHMLLICASLTLCSLIGCGENNSSREQSTTDTLDSSEKTSSAESTDVSVQTSSQEDTDSSFVSSDPEVSSGPQSSQTDSSSSQSSSEQDLSSSSISSDSESSSGQSSSETSASSLQSSDYSQSSSGESSQSISTDSSSEESSLTSVHEHVFPNEWSFDENDHYHVCKCGEIDERKPHQFGEWQIIDEATHVKEGLKRKTCTVCGYYVEETIPMVAHKFSTEWSFDENDHYHVCKCGEIDERKPHQFGEWQIIDEATHVKEGLKRKTCTVCDYFIEESIATRDYCLIYVYQGTELVKTYSTDMDGDYSLDIPDDSELYYAGYTTKNGDPFSVVGNIQDDVVVYLHMDSTPFSIDSEADLDYALASGIKSAVLTADLTITKPHYVISNFTLSCDKDVSITRSKNYGGDIFVVGLDANNQIVAATANPVEFTVSTGEHTISIDGNSATIFESAEPTVEVNGSVFFVAGLSTLNLSGNLIIENNKKNGNNRVNIFDQDTSTDAPYLSKSGRAGGSVIININSTVNIDGAIFRNNETNNSADVENDLSSNGGVIFNYGIVNVLDATFDGNKGTSGSAIYSARTVNVAKASFANNYSYSYGTIYLADSQYSSGTIESAELGNVVFENNSAPMGSGGAIFVSTNAILSVKGAKFTSNSCKNNGGAIASKGVAKIDGCLFKDNSSNSKGGAVYVYYGDSKDTEVARTSTIDDSTFQANHASLGSAVGLGNDAEATDVSEIIHAPTLEVANCLFKENVASKNSTGNYGHGTIYVQKKGVLNLFDVSFSDNSAEMYGGAIFATDFATVNIGSKENESGYANTFERNTAERAGCVYLTSKASLGLESAYFGSNSATNGGVIYATNGFVTASELSFKDNAATNNGGALYIYTSSELSFSGVTAENNTADNYGGFMYQSGASITGFSDIISTENSANTGGFIYITTANSALTVNSGSSKGCTATVADSENIYSNAKSTVVKVAGTDTKSIFDYDGTLFGGKGTLKDVD